MWVSPCILPWQRLTSRSSTTQLEGFTFYYYLQHHSLPTLEQAQASLIPPAPQPSTPAANSAAVSDTPGESASEPPTETPADPMPYFRVTIDDYLGGVADLTGELMRLAIASVGKNLSDSLTGGADGEGGGDFANIEKIGRLVREIKGGASLLVREDGFVLRTHASFPRRDGSSHAVCILAAEEAASARPVAWQDREWCVRLHLSCSHSRVCRNLTSPLLAASYNLRIRGAEYKDSPAMLQALARRMAEGGGERRGGDEVEASA